VTCDSIKKSIPLYIYGELAPEAEENLEAHTASCRECSAELEAQREFARALNSHELEPSLDLLVECRQTLAIHLQDETEVPRANRWTGLWTRLFGFPVNNFRLPAGALALFAMGWFAARTPQIASLLPGSSFASSANQAGMISTVRSIQPDPSGGVLISVDDTQRRVVSGGLADENMRKLLLAALRDDANPGVRVESVSLLKNLAGSEDVRNALLEALQHDDNPGVRLKALDGLQQFSYDPSVRRVLSSVLMSDANAGVRIQAIDLLTSRHDDSIVGILQNLVRKDDNDYVRLRCERALQEMNASVGTF
jgi:hypothetical protein